MNNIVAVCAMLCSITFLAIATLAAPWVISDYNKFLLGFVNQEFLSFMGVIVTITLASAANIHIELNRYEEAHEGVSFANTKRHVRHSAYALVGALCASILTVVIKPLVSGTETGQAVANGFALLILVFSTLILIDLTQAAFALEPLKRPKR
ncbi:MAG TPA: hypothetical protein VEZ16_12705 [Microvirga sp.]|nr:hypothetical protein [Microvirga sp.]